MSKKKRRPFKTAGVMCPDCSQPIRIAYTVMESGAVRIEGWAMQCDHHLVPEQARDLLSRELGIETRPGMTVGELMNRLSEIHPDHRIEIAVGVDGSTPIASLVVECQGHAIILYECIVHPTAIKVIRGEL